MKQFKITEKELQQIIMALQETPARISFGSLKTIDILVLKQGGWSEPEQEKEEKKK